MIVDLADNGRQAVDRVLDCTAQHPWDVILMDVQMSEMDGYAATAAIRRDPRFAALPIVALTAHVLQDERSRCYEAGMNDYISKPIDPPAMFATLQRWLGGRRLRDQSAPTGSQFPPIEGLNSEGGLARVAGNEGLYRSLLLRLAHGREATLATLERTAAIHGGVATPDPAQVQFLAHTLKGEAGNLGLYDVQAQAAELERLGRSRRVEAFGAALRTLRKTMESVSLALLAALDPAPSAHSQRPEEREKLDHLLSRLTEQLDSYDGSSPETLAETMPLLRAWVGCAKAESLGALVADFDFPAACLEVKRLRAELETVAV